ncbi:MAG TPA: CHAT domain-containing protein [Thermoanaerobaculia bacterium]
MSPVLLLALLSVAAVDFTSTFERRDLGQLMALWHSESPSRVADRKRLTFLALDDVRVALNAGGTVMQVRDPAGTLLEQYTLTMKDGRVWSLVRAEPATPLAEARARLADGSEAFDAGALEAAQAAFVRAVELADASGHAPTRAAAQRGLGAVAATRGDSPTAVTHYERALALSRAAGDRFGEACTLTRLGFVDRTSGELAQAEARFREALQIFQSLGHRLPAAHVQLGLAIVHSNRAAYDEAQPLLAEATRTFEELGELEGLADALNVTGVNARARGSFDTASAVLRRALALYRANGSIAGEGNALGNLAVALSRQGQYREAVIAFRESLAVQERLGRFHNVMVSLINLGEMYFVLGDHEQAREHLERALGMAEQAGFKHGVALTLHNMAQLRLAEDDTAGAIALFEKALAIDEGTGNRRSLGGTLHNLGRAHLVGGDTAAARSFFQRSFALAEEFGLRGEMVVSLGMLSVVAPTPDEGIALAQRMRELAGTTGALELTTFAHFALGLSYRRAGRYDEARKELEGAVAIVEELRRSVPGEEIDWQQAFTNLIMPYYEIVRVLVEQGDVSGALAYAERAKARVLFDVLRNGRPELGSALSEAERASESALAARLVDVNREHRASLVSGRVDGELLARVRKARLEYEGFLDTLFAARPQLRREQGELWPARTTDASALLAAGAADAFLEFVVTDEMTYLFVLTTAGGVRVHTIPVGRVKLKAEVMRFRELLANHDLAYGVAARALYDRLLAPAAAQLRGKRTLCIIPDGPLWELPFQALQPSSTEFLLDRHAIYFVPSLAVLREMSREPARPPAEQRLLALGNPVMPRETAARTSRVARRDASLAPLPHTETEIRQIAALYGTGNSRVYLRGAAREEVVKAEAGSYDVLHFATHGVLDNQNALYSRLVFSPSEAGGEDGLLEAREIMRLDLNARLAVLSACETARGRVGAGEGVIGLSWALFVAGVPTTVVSQWSVDSSSTAALMIAFHRHRVAGRSTAEALRSAALATRANPAYRHPFYWAPFVVVGSAR